MTYWNLTVVAVCTGLLLWLLWKEVKRPNKVWLAARLLASFAAVAGLAGMALPLSYSRKIPASRQEAVLLTEGYSSDSLQSFLRRNPATSVFSLIKNPVPNGYSFLPDVAFLPVDSGRYSRLHLFGNGLNEDELTAIQNIPFIFHPITATTGFTAINWNRQITSGEKLIVQGRFANDAAPVKLVLQGFGVALDSVDIPTQRSASFQLQTEPKFLDRAVLSILAIKGKDTLAKEPLPVEVVSTKPIRVLLLAAYPDFENKFLKNWLAQNGYPVAIRTRISKDKFSREYSNLSGTEITGINAALLSRFDVVVADAAELAAIASLELSALQSAVSQQGIGLLVKADSGIAVTHFYTRHFPLMQERSIVPVVLPLQFAADTIAKPLLLKMVQPLYIRPLPGTQPLLQTAKGQTVVSSQLQGMGKLLFTTLSNTYTWQLAGHQEDYATLWSTLLQQAAKKEVLPEVFKVNPGLPVVNEKVIIQLQTAYAEPPQVLVAATPVSMEQNYQLPFLWKGFYWPDGEGWVPLSTAHQTINWHYVFNKNDWQTVRAENKKQLTQSKAATSTQMQVPTQNEEMVIRSEISKWWFFMLFLLAASSLWFERKYHPA